MSVTPAELPQSLDPAQSGAEMYGLIQELYPICRSITGDGLRETLRRIGARIPLALHEVPSGTRVFDWVVPKEWNIRDAWIKNDRGERVIDFRRSNLHVLNYSVPVRATMTLAELRSRLFTLPGQPDWIPYRTSYYEETWGFCLSQRQLDAMPDGNYEVVIDSTLEAGHLTYGECLLRGATRDEVLIFTHVCHPSLCNDNLSGAALAVALVQSLANLPRRYSYRFVFAPATIGSIAWLSRNESRLSRIKHGLVLACLGDPGKFTYKKSRHGDAEIDRAAQHVLRHAGDHAILEFSPWGYDERQFGSPGINLPMGRLTRSPNGGYPEYHTSADNLELVRPEALGDSLVRCLQIFDVLESNACYRNTSPKGEPQLGRRGLYRKMGGFQDIPERQWALLWLLNLATGERDLLDIAERSGLEFSLVRKAAEDLLRSGLLVPRLESPVRGQRTKRAESAKVKKQGRTRTPKHRRKTRTR